MIVWLLAALVAVAAAEMGDELSQTCSAEHAGSLSCLTVDNSWLRELEVDPEAAANVPNTVRREVSSGHFVPVRPTPLPQPYLVAWSPAAAASLGLSEDAVRSEQFTRAFSGDVAAFVPFASSWATPYGHSHLRPPARRTTHPPAHPSAPPCVHTLTMRSPRLRSAVHLRRGHLPAGRRPREQGLRRRPRHLPRRGRAAADAAGPCPCPSLSHGRGDVGQPWPPEAPRAAVGAAAQRLGPDSLLPRLRRSASAPAIRRDPPVPP